MGVFAQHTAVSQPFCVLASQSRKPVLQEPMPHPPPLQPGVALATAPQTLPQLPQLLESVRNRTQLDAQQP